MKSIALLIEEDVMLRRSLTTLLETADYRVFSTRYDTAGMAVENLEHIDLIFIGLDSLDQSDKDYLLMLKLQNPGVRLVLLAPVFFYALPFDPFSCGVDAYLVKPCDPQAILRSTRKNGGMRQKVREPYFGIGFMNMHSIN
jgi:DNA-binding response OmpR family regulator